MKYTKKEKAKPQVGDIKQKVKFAYFPTKIGTQTIWLESYTEVFEYTEITGIDEVEVTSGLLEDVVVGVGLVNSRVRYESYTCHYWNSIDKSLM
jgi:hypothetical protein